MPRKPRFYAPNITCHIVQRGNNRSACFFSEDDFKIYINALTEALSLYNVKLHAFALMTNHVHLLMTPTTNEGISRVMQSVGRTYVSTINRLYQRTGTLWEGRHKACLIDSEAYFMACQRYIELNPVRANMVTHPSEYTWSSYQSNGMGRKIACLTPHPIYLALGDSPEHRQYQYRELFNTALPPEQIHTIRNCLNHNFPLGSDKFRADIEAHLNVRFGHLAPGHPIKPK
jgi:putative transposase